MARPLRFQFPGGLYLNRTQFLGLHYATVSRALARGEAQRLRSGMLDCKT